MKAIVWTKYGPPEVLQLQEVETPTPKDDEVLIKIHATTVLIGDCWMRSLKVPFPWQLPMRLLLGFRKPTRRPILGQELAGEVEAVGQNVTKFKKGDPVLAATLLRLSTYAEYICLPESYPALKPANLTYEEAATLPTGGVYGLHLLRQAQVQAGQKVLIIGAGGSIGTYAVQIAKAFGAEVTAVDSPDKLDLLRSIGADQVIDYTKGDYTRSGQTYDAIIDVVGKSSFSGCLRLLKPNGYYILGNPGLFAQLRGQWVSMTTEKKILSESATHAASAYTALSQLAETGKIKPVIDRRYPLAQMAQAHAYVETGRKKGSVVITVAG